MDGHEKADSMVLPGDVETCVLTLPVNADAYGKALCMAAVFVQKYNDLITAAKDLIGV